MISIKWVNTVVKVKQIKQILYKCECSKIRNKFQQL
jgi:hypothetical protein